MPLRARCARRPGSRPSSSRSSATSSTSTSGAGVFKVVSFFLFRYRFGSLRDYQRAEVDGAEWIPLEEAPRRLAHRGERDMAQAALSKLAESV